jgi:hypothetical protein
MQTYQVTFPAGVPFEVIAQSLKYLGGEIVEGAAVAPVRKASPRKAAAVQDYQDLTVYKNGEAVREIDGVTVAKLIAKMDGARKRAHSTVHRVYPDFPAMQERLRKADHVNPAHEYMQVFCQDLRHVKADYTNGVKA